MNDTPVIMHVSNNLARSYRYAFNGMEKDDEVKGQGNSLDFGARMYDGRLGRWLSTDPASNIYPHLSPYAYTANNPIWYRELDGRVFDYSNLSSSERQEYDALLGKLNQNKLFAIYYRALSNSEVVYTVKSGGGFGGSGSYSPSTNTIHFIMDVHTMSQEIFHAYQEDLGIYTDKDKSVRELEGDLISANINLSIEGYVMNLGNFDDQGIGFNEDYTDDDYNFNEGIISDEFDQDFNNAAESRINSYKKRGIELGEASPLTYTQNNSGVGALALKHLVLEAKANDDGLVGPRLENGDFYPVKEQ